MKKIIRVLIEKLSFKGSPPPYRENDDNAFANDDGDHDDIERDLQEYHEPINVLPSDALDLLANCKNTNEDSYSEVEYAEIQDMGIWHSTPLSHRHKSKISLTWVLKDNLDLKNKPSEKHYEDRVKNTKATDYDRHRQRFTETESNRKCKSQPNRIVGRNEHYHNLRFRSAYEEFVCQDTLSDDTASTEHTRKRHRHKHRRRKKRQEQKFGYDIRDLDSFLSEATIDRPGNIPVVIAYPTTLHQTHRSQRELALPLGTVVNAVFKSRQWVFAQTPHGHEGYVLYAACLPLGILPTRPSPQKKTPCWESSNDIYPQPCGNLTDNEKEQLRGRTRSESRYRTKHKRRTSRISHAEQNFDTLYLKTKSVCSDMDRIGKENINTSSYRNETNRSRSIRKTVRQTLLVVNSDFKGSALNKTLSVTQGDVVVMLQGESESKDWFYVRKRDGSHGFIPADIAGHGYI